MARRSIYSIAPDAPFLPTLATRVLDGTLLDEWPRTGPFWLSDVTIILPTRRARLGLAEAFLAQTGGALLLPDIRTLGEDNSEEAPFLPPFDAEPIPPAASTIERTLCLARLVDAWARSPAGAEVLASPPNAAEILGLAESLGTVLDDLTIEDADLTAFEEKVGALDVAENWRQTRAFLSIVLDTWPAILAASGRADAVDLRNRRLRREAEAASAIFGDRPVIAAGSTGSIPATADLLAAIARLPRGAVVLPGLDLGLTGPQHESLIDPANNAHGHPQYGLARLLRRLGTTHAAVTELRQAAESPRLEVIRRALAPADETADWAAAREALAPDLASALDGVSVIAARTEAEEALAIAVAARDALASGREVGIVSPDQVLSRRIAAELLRFGIEVDDAAGVPLFQSALGRLLRQSLAVAANGFAALDVAALLHNPAVGLGLGRAEVARRLALLELGVLRGQRVSPGPAGLFAGIAANVERRAEHLPRRLDEEEGEAAADLVTRLADALSPIVALLARPTVTGPDLVAALATMLDRLIAEASPPTGLDEFRHLVESFAISGEAGPSFAPRALDQVLAALLSGVTVTEARPRRGDIAIWGRLEARLQNPDLLILAGINEDVWPEPADPGPWLSRGMRLAAGLEPPERRHGLAAHDFEMGMGNAQVIVAYAQRRGTAPALPSRLVQRLDAFIGETEAKRLRERGQVFVAAASRLDLAATPPRPAPRPTPRPDASKRPRRLSITEIETLFRSPYDIYARHVLRLRPLPALGAPPDARERGAMVHDVFARFVMEGHDFAAPDAAQRLMALADEAFAGLDAIGERRDIWLARFAVAADQFLAFELAREPRVLRRHAEIAGTWSPPHSVPFSLSGRADRIDEMRDGTLEILDFKTGSIPSPKLMQALDAPQLPLEAAMARAGGFDAVAPAAASALTYLKIGLGPEALVETPFRVPPEYDVPAVAEAASMRMQRLVSTLLLSDAHPMAARIRPLPGQRHAGDYDHLARTAEWTIAAGDDSP